MSNDWQHSKSDIFWAEIAPCDHVVQIYETDTVFLDALAGFVGGGINAGDCCIVIATESHLKALEDRLTAYGIHIAALRADNRYIPLNAEETLSRFMVNGWPDEALFMTTISEVINKNRTNNRKIRAFGEMVALLWANGLNGATVHLEHLWNKYCEKEKLCLFCAYPRSGFTGDINDSFQHICSAHSIMIEGGQQQLTDIYYRETAHSIAS
jgi:hypothetical protein